MPLLELALLIPLAVTAPHRHVYESGRRRMASIALTAIVTLANIAALCFLIHFLVTGGSSVHGKQLLLGGAQIWWTNVIVFALWFWELDGGGPPARLREPKADRDFAFIQMTDPEVSQPDWRPHFFDYFYVSFTNASAFSPTDTMPLTRTAKQLMLIESTISLLTLLLVAARAVNILTADGRFPGSAAPRVARLARDEDRHAHRRRRLPRPEPGDPRRLPAALGGRPRDGRRPERLARDDRRRT